MTATLQFDRRILSLPHPKGLESAGKGSRAVRLKVPASRSIQQTLYEHHISFSQAVAAVVNGQTADLGTILEPGDEVRLLPQIAGGH